MKLVSDIKEFLILNDFPSVNESITDRSKKLQEFDKQTRHILVAMKEDLSTAVHELEDSYYLSSFK